MTQIKDILQPAKTFNEAKDAFAQNTKDYFDGLVKKSKINIDANKESCSKYYAKVEEKNHFEKKVKSTGVLKGFLFFLAVVFYLAMVVGILTIAVPQLKIEPI
ncbi:MAG: hypothetical protein MJ223_00415 [Mycoplasmoidaceae bacterium]|nr:hypothetical protein [Mycoplasmoidaceae bacterium]